MGELRPGSFLLWLRAWLLGSVALLSGTVAHTSAAGLLPSWPALGGLLLACTVAGATFLRRRASGVRLVALVLAGQTAVHLVLTMLAGHRGDAPVAGPAVPAEVVPPAAAGQPAAGSATDQLMAQLLAEHPAHATGAGGAAPTLGTLPHLVDHVVEQGPLMLLAHTAAAAALGLWLAVGERALWALLTTGSSRLGSWAARVLALGSSPDPALIVAQVRPARGDAPVVRRPQLANHTFSLRGPPVLLG